MSGETLLLRRKVCQ